MTLDELQQGLVELANSGDSVFAQAAQQINELTEQEIGRASCRERVSSPV